MVFNFFVFLFSGILFSGGIVNSSPVVYGYAFVGALFTVQIGDEVILLGTDAINTISAQKLSEFGESVSGEVTCAISKRVPRIYNKIELSEDI